MLCSIVGLHPLSSVIETVRRLKLSSRQSHRNKSTLYTGLLSKHFAILSVNLLHTPTQGLSSLRSCPLHTVEEVTSKSAITNI